MNKIAILEGASPLGQKAAEVFEKRGYQVLCVDSLATYPSPSRGQLLKRDSLEVGPLEMAFKKDSIDEIFYIPKNFQNNESQVHILEAHISSFLGILKIARTLRFKKIYLFLADDSPEESQNLLQKIFSEVEIGAVERLIVSTDFL